jgi:hypothetical protein
MTVIIRKSKKLPENYKKVFAENFLEGFISYLKYDYRLIRYYLSGVAGYG